jgi:hypothetical protein
MNHDVGCREYAEVFVKLDFPVRILSFAICCRLAQSDSCASLMTVAVAMSMTADMAIFDLLRLPEAEAVEISSEAPPEFPLPSAPRREAESSACLARRAAVIRDSKTYIRKKKNSIREPKETFTAPLRLLLLGLGLTRPRPLPLPRDFAAAKA